MKKNLRTLTLLLSLALFCQPLLAQDEIAVVAPASEAAEGLDLHAVSELFREAEDLEAFEKSLNDPDVGVNNLDLDANGEVDYIRVVDQVSGDVHVIIMQVQLSETEFQDVATIDIEKTDDDYNMQIHGNEVIYGPDYYYAPTVHIHAWPLIGWIYRPYYRPYRSAFYFGFYPPWWRPYRPVGITVYRSRTVRFTSRATFRVTKVNRVTTARTVYKTPRSSTLVKKTTYKASPRGNVTGTKVSKTTTNPRTGKTTTTKKVGGKATNPRTGKTTTVKGGSKKVTNPKTGKSTTVKGGVKKTKNPKTGKTTTTKKGSVKRKKQN